MTFSDHDWHQQLGGHVPLPLSIVELNASLRPLAKWPDQEIAALMTAVQGVVTADPVLTRNHALLLTIPGIGAVTAPTLLAELPNIAEFTPKGLRRLLASRRRSTAWEARCADQHASVAWAPSGFVERSTYACSAASDATRHWQASWRG